jgi:hypothetical protein
MLFILYLSLMVISGVEVDLSIGLMGTVIVPSSYQNYAITGLILGDGNLNNPGAHRRSTGNFRMAFTFSADFKDFIWWLKFNVLKNLCTDSLPTPYPKINPTQYWFSTKSLPYFTNIANLWYVKPNGKLVKILPTNEYLNENFNEVSLAFLIMGDGYWNSSHKTVLICTDNFKLDEVKRLVQFLDSTFSLKATLNKRTNQSGVCYRLRFSGKQDNLDNLRSLVAKHTHPSMLYKLNILY